jgi:hypothetical protein
MRYVRMTPTEGTHHRYTASPLSDTSGTKGKRSRKASDPMCTVNGHQWIKTISDKVQACERKECRQMRQLIQGHWRFVGKKNDRTSEAQFLEQVELREQIALWNEEER